MACRSDRKDQHSFYKHGHIKLSVGQKGDNMYAFIARVTASVPLVDWHSRLHRYTRGTDAVTRAINAYIL